MTTKLHTILVAFDGDTWGDVDGASICIITDEDRKRLESGEITPGDLKPLTEIMLKNLAPTL